MLGNNSTHIMEETKVLTKTQKRAISDKKHLSKMKLEPDFPRKEFIKNILIGSRKKLEGTYKPSAPSKKNWDQFHITSDDINDKIYPGLFNRWNDLFENLKNKSSDIIKHPVCQIIDDTDDDKDEQVPEQQGVEESKESEQQPEQVCVEECKNEEAEEDPFEFLENITNDFYQYASTNQPQKKPFDNKEFAKYIESFDTIGLELAKHYIDMKLKYPWDNRFIFSEDKIKINNKKVYFTSEDIKTHIENRTCSDTHKKNQLYYYNNKKNAFTSNDLYVDSPFVIKLMERTSFRESIKQYLTSQGLHETAQYKAVYAQLETFRKNNQHLNKQNVEIRNDTEALKVTRNQLVKMTESLTGDERIISRLYHLNTCHIRNDFHTVYLKKQTQKANYLDLGTNKFYLNIYKSEGKGLNDEKIYDIDEVTISLIKESIKIYPRTFLFCSKYDPNLPMDPKESSELLRNPVKRTFNIESLYISDLRSAHATWAYRVYSNNQKVLNLAEREKIASDMCHSTEMQQSTYLRKRSIETIE